MRTILLGIIVSAWAGCSTSEKQPDAIFEDVTWTGFRLRTAALTMENCSQSTEDGSAKISSNLTAAFASNGMVRVIVSMKATVVTGTLPDPTSGQRGDPTRDATWMSWVSAAAESQRCAVLEATDEGASYEQSFVLGNAFTAQMSQMTAMDLSTRTDVRHLEAADTSSSP